MCTLHIEASPFMHLLRFFRTGHLPASIYDKTKLYETSLRLGGFEALDARIRRVLGLVAAVLKCSPVFLPEAIQRDLALEMQDLLDDLAAVVSPVPGPSPKARARGKAKAKSRDS